MLGTQDNPGIYSRALNDLFLLVAKYEEENVYNVSMSYLEVSQHVIFKGLSKTGAPRWLFKLNRKFTGAKIQLIFVLQKV